MFPKNRPDEKELHERELHNRRLERKGAAKVWQTIRYKCDCGRDCKLRGELLPGGEYFAICPKCLKWTLLGAPVGTAVK